MVLYIYIFFSDIVVQLIIYTYMYCFWYLYCK